MQKIVAPGGSYRYSKLMDKQRLEAIRLATPGPVARHLNKRISLPISAQLVQWKIHPNWVSFFNIALGWSTGFFVAQGTYPYYLLGGFLFQMASIFDGCDGEVAKLRGMTSKFGEYLDSISDNGALISFFAGLLIANFHWGLAIFLTAGLAVLFFQIILFLKRNTRSASLVTFDKEFLSKLSLNDGTFLMTFIRYGRVLMRKDVFSLLFFLFALAGWLPAWLYIAAGGTWIANGILLWLKTKKYSSSTSTEPSSIR